LVGEPTKDKFPSLFNIVRRKQDSIAKVLASVLLNISFRRNLVGKNLRDWYRIVVSLHDVYLQGERDTSFEHYVHQTNFLLEQYMLR